jgi:NAD(P)-dependent dehydrogenase (short-subunit alcohol dehydrogenase family)
VSTKRKTIIVTGASQRIGAAVANLFFDRGYNVLGNSRKISHKNVAVDFDGQPSRRSGVPLYGYESLPSSDSRGLRICRRSR